MNDLVKSITDNWEDAIGYGLTAVQGRIDYLGAKTVFGAYYYGPAANLPSVKGVLSTVDLKLRTLDLAAIEEVASQGSKVKEALTPLVGVGKIVVVLDVSSRVYDTFTNEDPASRALANIVDFGAGALIVTGVVAGGTALALSTPLVVGGAIISGIGYGVVSTYAKFTDTVQNYIQPLTTAVGTVIVDVVSNPSGWEVDALGNPTQPIGFYDTTDYFVPHLQKVNTPAGRQYVDPNSHYNYNGNNTTATNLGGALADRRLGWSEKNLGGQLADNRREGESSVSGHSLGSAGNGVASGVMKDVGSVLGQGAASTVAYQDGIQRAAKGYEGVNATFSYPYYDDAIIRAAKGYQGVDVSSTVPVQSSATVTQQQVDKVLVNDKKFRLYGHGVSGMDRTSWTDKQGHPHWGTVAETRKAASEGTLDHMGNSSTGVASTGHYENDNPEPDQKGKSNLPVLLDLDGNGVKITEYQNSTQFMAGKDGLMHRSSWAGAGDGVLFYDPDGRNAITEARQYVFTDWAPTARDDLEAIRQVWDTNGDGKLTSADAAFAKFKVMVTNADGSTSVKTLTELGITEIDLTAKRGLVSDAAGDREADIPWRMAA